MPPPVASDIERANTSAVSWAEWSHALRMSAVVGAIILVGVLIAVAIFGVPWGSDNTNPIPPVNATNANVNNASPTPPHTPSPTPTPKASPTPTPKLVFPSRNINLGIRRIH